MNSLRCDYNNFIDENFILPKSMHLCVLKFIDNTRVDGGEHQDMEEINMKHDDLMRRIGDYNLNQVRTCMQVVMIILQVWKHVNFHT